MATNKKFVIKPYKQHAQMDRQRATTVWGELSGAIDEIFRKNASNLSFEHLYRNAYNLVLHKHAEILYQGVQNSVQTYLNTVSTFVANASDERLLEEINLRWGEHQVTMSMVRDILMYMDRTYVPQHNKTKVYDLGLRIFRDAIARHPQVKDRLRSLLLGSIRAEREGQLVDRSLLRSTLSMLMELGIEGTAVYEEDFEREFLRTTRAFYRAESLDVISKNTCPVYMRKAEQRLLEEQERVAQYLDRSTDPKLRAILEEELVKAHASSLIEMEGSGCRAMFRDAKTEDLERMYLLFARIPSTLEELRGAMAEYVKSAGRELVADQERVREPVVFVKGLLDMRDKFDRIVSDAFQGEKAAQKKLQEAFEDFINMDTRCAHYLALYVDDLLKVGLKGMTEEEADGALSKFIVIFKFLQDKDVFENYYKQHLSKRLLGGRSVNDEFEKQMIVKLKTECGYHFTSKLEGMFNDMRLSKDAMEEFRKAGVSRVGGVELEVNMLTMGYWPSQALTTCNLPPEIKACCQVFQNFYLNKHSGRKVTWQAGMGSADIRATFGNGRKHELNVHTYSMCILMLFNAADTLTLEDIQKATQIPENELRRNLISLCTNKHRILRKASKGKGVTDNDRFTFNANFTSKLRRIKVPLVSMKEAVVDGRAGEGEGGGGGLGPGGERLVNGIPAAVEEDRRHLVEAAIVRIMKARRKLGHNELIAEVTRQLSMRFPASPPFIKNRIESLIERDYLERGANDRKTYAYLA